MANRVNKLQQGIVVGLLIGALALLTGCGGNRSGSGGEGGSEAQPTRRELPTMPSAKFAAPTTMITPQSEQVEASATMTATEALTETEAAMESEAVTTTEELTATEDVTGSEEISETQ